jgi:exosome complex component CSL4
MLRAVQVVMAECFRPGDLLRAEVLSLGTQRDYYLSTARNELGVIWARSQSGSPMAAVSWVQMRCPVSGQVEGRKVAKVPTAGE